MATIEQRIDHHGKPVFRVKIRLKGFPQQTATFRRVTDARKWVLQTESAIREGRYFKHSEAKRRTLGELIDRYLSEIMPNKPKSKATQTKQLLWWKDKLGDRYLIDITPAVIAEHRGLLATEPTAPRAKNPRPDAARHYLRPSSVARYLSALSHVFTIAVKEWGWLDDSPMRKVSKPKEPRGRARYLSDEERHLLLAACKASRSRYLYAIVVLAISTGMRRGEIMNLHWNQLDLGRQRIILNDTKNGERRAIPLVSHAYDILRAMSKIRRIDTTLLFPGKNPSKPFELKKAWVHALKTAGIHDFRFHDLRHSAASYLAMNGASLIEIAAVLGHRTMQMVKRYSHIAESHTHKVVTSMNDKIFAGTERSEVQHES